MMKKFNNSSDKENENIKSKFTYEDVVDYLLRKLPEDKVKDFEYELEKNKELQELHKIASSRLSFIKKIDEHKVSDNVLDNIYSKIQNISSDHQTKYRLEGKKLKTYLSQKIKPGQIWKFSPDSLYKNLASSEDFDFPEAKQNLKSKLELLDDVYFLVLYSNLTNINKLKDLYLVEDTVTKNNPEYYSSERTYRCLVLSTKPSYARNYDLLFTEPLISFKDFNSVAHMHLVSFFDVSSFMNGFYIGEINRKIFNAILYADLGNYSLVDGKIIKRGNEKIDEYLDDEIEIWTDLMREALSLISEKSFEEIDRSEFVHPFGNEEEKTNERIFYFISSNSFKIEQNKFYYDTKGKREEIEYDIDEEGFLIIKENRARILEKLKRTQYEFNYQLIKLLKKQVDETRLRIIQINHDRLKKMIYHKIKEDVEPLIDLERFKQVNFIKVSTPEFETRELAYAARTLEVDFRQINIPLFSDPNMDMFFVLKHNMIYLEIDFKEEVKKLKNFSFIHIEKKLGIIREEVEVKERIALIPLNFAPEDVISLQNGYIIQFVYNNLEVSIPMKLVFT